ncbi:MAG: superoxide dismutase [Deltaproteobacteria bacterium]|nr:superoxide dismutase [Deltaproteobacteria bacterium]
MPFSLPALPYALNALAPAIDQQTMELHHGKHHRAYFDKLNSVLTDKKYATLIDILKNTSQLPASVRNNAGGHWNHSFFWTIMTPESKESEISSKLKREIEKSFGSFASFKEKFEAGAKDVFGSGWVWLVKDADGKLKILTTANQDNPLMDISKETGTPILALDVWEHAYYLTYQNRRADYITGFWKVVNWKQVFDYYREK